MGIYEFEFSPITNYQVNKLGLFQQEELISHWSKIGVDIYIAYNYTIPIGFTVVNLCSMLTYNPNIRDIAEFFVMPFWRNAGVGKWMACEIFNLYPGVWEVRQFPNLTIKEFWIKTICEFSKGRFVEFEKNDYNWTGSVQRFEVSLENIRATIPIHLGYKILSGSTGT